jgi:hypothetical protein
MADDYETCMDELASELAAVGFPEESCNFIIEPAKRRREKQTKFYFPKDEV